MMKILRRILGAVLVISAALALLTLMTDAMAGSGNLMLRIMAQHAPAEETGLAAENYAGVTGMIAGYLSGEVEDFQYTLTPEGAAEQPLFNQREQTHMADVLKLFQLLRTVELGTLFLALLLFLVCFFLRRPDRQALRGFRDGLRLVLGVIAALLIWGAIDFDSLFILFHRLAFTNDLWLLDPATDLLIRLMPIDFFIHYAALIAGTWLGFLCLAEAGVEYVLRKGRKGPRPDAGKEHAP